MHANEDKTIGGLNLLLKDTEYEAFLFLEKGDIVWCTGDVGKIENVINIMTSCSGHEMTIPGVPEAIFLEDIIVREAAFDTFTEVIDGRIVRGHARSQGHGTWNWCRWSDTPSLESRSVQVEPTVDSRSRNLPIPREERVDFPHLDSIERICVVPRRKKGE